MRVTRSKFITISCLCLAFYNICTPLYPTHFNDSNGHLINGLHSDWRNL